MPSAARFAQLIILCLAASVAMAACRNAGEIDTEKAATGGLSESDVLVGDLGANIHEYLTGLAPDRFAGSVLVARQGHVLLNKGYGMAIRSANIPNSSESVIVIGSITKQFTAAGILKLEMQGALDTNDTLPMYFEQVPDEKQGITLHQLLTHTAGLINYTGDWDAEGDFEIAPRDETLQEALDAPLLSAPGTEFHYSNSSYSVLAAIIEKVSGQSYEEYLSENIFKPASMHTTGYRMPDWESHIVAHYYAAGEDLGGFLERPYPQWNVLGNGGILTTTGDLYRYHLALEGEEILSAAAKEKFYRPFLDDYAYGWSIKQTDHGLLIQHSGGGSFGSSDSAIFRRYVDAGVVIVVLGHQAYEGQSMTGQVTSQVAEMVLASG